MSEGMRQEMNEVKARLSGVETTMGAVVARLGAVETRLDTVEIKLDAVETKLDAVEVKVTNIDTRLSSVEKTTRNLAVVVAGHTEAFVRIEKQLTKLDELDAIKRILENFTSEIIASRHERTLMGKGFFDQQETLTDHELRLTRLERDRKPS